MADTTIAFLGIRLDLEEGDIEALEDRSHPILVNAKKAGLEYYWGNFGAPGERYLMFVGKCLAKLGLEGNTEVQIEPKHFAQVVADVTDRIAVAGFAPPFVVPSIPT